MVANEKVRLRSRVTSVYMNCTFVLHQGKIFEPPGLKRRNDWNVSERTDGTYWRAKRMRCMYPGLC